MKKKQLLFGLIIFNIIFISVFFTPTSKNIICNSLNKESKDEFKIKNINTSNYSSSFQNNGGNFNITLHESILDNKLKKITNFSDINNRTITINSPKISNFNSSFTNISITNIIAKNYNLIVEDDNVNYYDNFDNTNPDATSFQTIGNAYLENISVFVRNIGGANATVTAVLYKSKWNAGSSRSEPDGTNSGYITTLGTFNVPNNTLGTYSITNIHYFLNSSKTENNTWFIGLFDGGLGGADTIWYYVDDDSDGDNEDESYSYYYNSGWILKVEDIFGNSYVDFRLTVGLSPINNTPKPSDINLKINGTAVNNNGTDNSGYWVSNEAYWSASGNIKFVFSVDWWNVKLNISKVQINYTKTDLTADSNFIIKGSGQDVLWNVTRPGGLNYFEGRFSNYKINFTIPEKWNNINVFNGSVNKTNSITIKNRADSFKDIIVHNAGNGTYWFLNATSSNLLQSIDTYVNNNPVNMVNYTNIVHFNATFSEKIGANNGLINLSVYGPVGHNNINYTSANSTFPTGTKISLGNWDVSDNATIYGKYRVQVYWYNDTDAGFLEIELPIKGETDLKIIKPAQNLVYNSSQVFNITLYFNDTSKNQPIPGANIQYRINSGTWRTDNIYDYGNGYYNITIYCNESSFDGYGDFSIQINASKYCHLNQSVFYNMKILGETNSQIDSPAQDQTFDSDQILTIYVEYNDTVKGTRISSASVQWMVVGKTGFLSTNVSFIAGTGWRIRIWLSYSAFDGYGDFTIRIHLNKTNYYNQSEDLNFRVLGKTNSQIDSPAQGQTFDSDQILT
ncbi:MAG: hypothetical protein ACTSRP_24925, partial [Candidatus Helarchaeota archaeon]